MSREYQLSLSKSVRMILHENAERISNSTTASAYLDLLFTNASEIGWVFGLAMPFGWILLLILLIMVTFSLPCVRRNRFFEVTNFCLFKNIFH